MYVTLQILSLQNFLWWHTHLLYFNSHCFCCCCSCFVLFVFGNLSDFSIVIMYIWGSYLFSGHLSFSISKIKTSSNFNCATVVHCCGEEKKIHVKPIRNGHFQKFALVECTFQLFLFTFSKLFLQRNMSVSLWSHLIVLATEMGRWVRIKVDI